MVLNPFFTQGTSSEQNLVQDLINEQLRTYGVDIFYLPRKFMTENTVIREVVQSKFDMALPLEAYVDNYDQYSGAGNILSKFGIESNGRTDSILASMPPAVNWPFRLSKNIIRNESKLLRFINKNWNQHIDYEI